MACLFCLKILPKGKDHEYVEETVTTENGGEFTLKISLKNPDKNLEAFNCLCTLLKVKWRSSFEDGDGDKDNNQFDIRRPLPLCRRCQQAYQEVDQLYQQIKELEVLIMTRANLIKETIEDTETGGLRLTCEKLNEFRQMVLASPKSNLLDSDGDEEKDGSPDELMSEHDGMDNDGQELKVIDPLTAVVFPKRVSYRVKIRREKKKQSVKQKPQKSNTTRVTLRSKITKESTLSTTTKLIAVKNDLSSLPPPSISSSSMSPRNDEKDANTSLLSNTPTTAPAPKKNRIGRQSKLVRVTESTPKIHVDCFTCCYCGLRYKTTGGLSMHRRFHEPPTHGCPICPKMFANKYQMKRHLKGIHKNEQVPETTPSAPAKVA